MAEKQERRSIADAMNVTPEALAFIKGAPEKTIEVKPTASRKEATASEVEFEPVETDLKNDPGPTPKTPSESARRRTYRSNDERSVGIRQEGLGFGMTNLLVPITSRLQPSTASVLKRAALEQKLRGQQPSSLQEIIELSVQNWLRTNGYLK